MSIANEITMLERKLEDLEQARSVAVNERTGRADALSEQMRVVERNIAALRPLAEAPAIPSNPMPSCVGCGRRFWPESLTAGRCEDCGPEVKKGKTASSG